MRMRRFGTDAIQIEKLSSIFSYEFDAVTDSSERSVKFLG